MSKQTAVWETKHFLSGGWDDARSTYNAVAGQAVSANLLADLSRRIANE